VHTLRHHRERANMRHKECGLLVVPISLGEVCLRLLGLAEILCPMPKTTVVESPILVVVIASIIGVGAQACFLRGVGATSSTATGLGRLGAPLAVVPLLHPSEPLLLGEVELAAGQQRLIWG
jgi:hypothetical protein